MACVNVTSVNVLDNPSRFVNPFQFEISFECIHPLKEGSPHATPTRNFGASELD